MEAIDLTKNFRIQLSRFISKLLVSFNFKGIGKIREILAHLIVPKPNSTSSYIIPQIYGNKIIVRPYKDTSIDTSLYFHGHYECGTIDLISKLLKPGETFFDIGANIGSLSLPINQIFNNTLTTFCFEPVKLTFNILKENIKINDFQKIESYRFGFGSKDEKLSINVPNDARGAASLLEMENSLKETIEIKTLDNFIIQNNIQKVDLIKVDVEGWELEVLKGGREFLKKADAPILCIECSNTRTTYDGSIEEIYNFIRNVNDYTIYKPQKSKESISKLIEVSSVEQLPQHNNIYCLLPVHKSRINLD